MNFNCGIYRLKNKITGKSYIGQSQNLFRRKDQFLNFDNYKYAGRKINEARKRYNNSRYWDYEVLTYCEPKQLDEQERKYIKKYDSVFNGYNIQPGGNTKIIIDHFKPYYQYMDSDSRFLMEIGKGLTFNF